MLTRFGWVSMTIALILAGCGGGGGGGGGGPTGPTAAIDVAGHYTGTGSIVFQREDDCDNLAIFGFASIDLEGDVRQTGNILDMDVSVLVPDDTSFAPIVCFFDGTLNNNTFSATLRTCSAPPSFGADPTLGIECSDGTTRDATATGGFWSGSFAGGRHTGTVRVTFSLVNPATGAAGGTVSVERNLDLVRGS